MISPTFAQQADVDLPGPPIRATRPSAPSSSWLQGDYLLCLLITFSALVLWHVRSTGAISLRGLAVYGGLLAAWAGFGMALSRSLAPTLGFRLGPPQQILLGYFCANSIGFVLALASPLSASRNAVIVLALAACCFALSLLRRLPAEAAPRSYAGTLACLASAVAATWWCSDVQPPMLTMGSDVVLQTWKDAFIHARILSAFEYARGLGTLQDLRLSGVSAPVYHFASYITPASIAALADLRPLQVYASFQLPFGVFLTGLAAFTLTSAMVGRWAACAAAMAVLALPDAFLQGFGNRYLSYFFVSQVNLGMLYGIAAAALAWFFVIQGTSQKKFSLIFIGYVWLGICLFYKAHLFVANAYLLLIFPCLFMQFHWTRRLLAWCALTFVFVSVIWYAQRIPSIPLIKLDFSGVGAYASSLLPNFDPGFWRDFYHGFFIEQHHGKALQAIVFIGMVASCTLGLWLPVLALLLVAGRRRLPLPMLAFPLLVLANYLIMSSGLALDTHGVGTVDELLNRPLVWAYFAIAAWCAAAGWTLLWGADLPRARPVRLGIGVAAVALCMWPIVLGHNLQTFPARPGNAHYQDFNSVPLCLVNTANYVRLHSLPSELVQDSLNDPRFIVTALTERQAYLADGAFMHRTAEIEQRTDSLAKALAGDRAALTAYMREHKISWLIWDGEPTGTWSTSVQPAYECGPYKAFDAE
jgi:hypothetical protein